MGFSSLCIAFLLAVDPHLRLDLGMIHQLIIARAWVGVYGFTIRYGYVNIIRCIYT